MSFEDAFRANLNLDPERALLGAILLGGAAINDVIPILGESDFCKEANSRIYGTMIGLSQRGVAIDLVTVGEELSRNGGREKAGGPAYLSGLIDGVPDIGNVEHYARIVKEKATRRQLIELGEKLARDGRSADKTAAALVEEARDGLGDLEAAGEAKELLPRRSLLGVLDGMPPPGARLATGIPALDRSLRGGLAPGRIYTFVGPPHRGKTILASQLARIFATRHGLPVVALYSDEGAWQAALMVLEGAGLDRDALEDRYAESREDVAALIGESGLDLNLDLPPEDCPLDLLIASVEHRCEERNVLLVLDSIQTIRPTSDCGVMTPKDRAEAVMKLLRGAIRRHPTWTIVLTSKANRGSYAPKPGERIDPMAAGLDSSSIEYGSDWLSFLEGDPDNTVRLHICKNRPGDGSLPTIPLRLDRQRATFAEVDAVEAEREREDSTIREHEKVLSKLGDAVLGLLAKGGPLNVSAIRERVSSKRADLLAALNGLEAQGAARWKPGPKNSHVWEAVRG